MTDRDPAGAYPLGGRPGAWATLLALSWGIAIAGCSASRSRLEPEDTGGETDAGPMTPDPPPDDPDPDPDALTDAIDRFERATRAATCSRAAQCDPRYLCPGGRMTTRGISAAQVAAARDGRLRFDGDVATECVADLLHRRCDDPYPTACRVRTVGATILPEPVMGTQGRDEPCRDDLECVPDLYCDRSSCDGRCRPRPDVGERCGTFGGDCRPGTFCDWRGAMTEAGSAPACAPLGAVGASCSSGRECEAELGCVDGVCAATPTPIGPGGSCGRSRECEPGLACQGGTCIPQTAPAEELRCGGDDDCRATEVCQESVVGSGIRICVAVETWNDAGEACEDSGDCLYLSQACIDGVCRPRGRPGETCGSPDDPPCELGAPCREGRCGLPVGEACNPYCPWCGAACVGWCRPEPSAGDGSGLCAPPLAEGEPCGAERGFGACDIGLECRRGATVNDYRCRRGCAE